MRLQVHSACGCGAVSVLVRGCVRLRGRGLAFVCRVHVYSAGNNSLKMKHWHWLPLFLYFERGENEGKRGFQWRWSLRGVVWRHPCRFLAR